MSPSQKKAWTSITGIATLQTVAYKAPLSMEFSRQEYWSGLPFPSPGALPDPGIKPGSPALQADALPSEARSKSSQASPWKDSITQKSAKLRGNVII